MMLVNSSGSLEVLETVCHQGRSKTMVNTSAGLRSGCRACRSGNLMKRGDPAGRTSFPLERISAPKNVFLFRRMIHYTGARTIVKCLQ